MVNVRTPINPVQKRGLWPPVNGREYVVQDSDTWGRIADRERVDVGGLIAFNFATHVPEEVNWYLRELVGCRVSTDGGRNFAFVGADPAKRKIYIPPLADIKPPTTIPWWDKLAKLQLEVEHSSDPQRERFSCLLAAMRNRRDDRVIFWDDIAPGPETPVPLGVRRGHRGLGEAKWLFDNFKTWRDVAALPLGDGTDPRRFVVSFHKYLFETADGSLNTLREANAAIDETHVMLKRWAKAGDGGRSMPREYRAIKEFVMLGEHNRGSLLDCMSTTGE